MRTLLRKIGQVGWSFPIIQTLLARCVASIFAITCATYGNADLKDAPGTQSVPSDQHGPAAGSGPPVTPFGRQDWWVGGFLVAAIFLAYESVWNAGFIWDDDRRITANPCIVGPLGLQEIWTTKAADLCPLVLTVFWVEHAVWGLWPLPYHLVNLALHATCAILLWRVLKSLQVPGAWLGTALWALHPVQVETAAWVTEMKNTQSALFYLLAILFYVRGIRARAAGDKKEDIRNYGLTLLFAALAMASKSSTVVLPIVLGLCVWWFEGRWNCRNLTRLAPFAVMAIIPSALTLWTQTHLFEGTGDQHLKRSLPEHLITAGDAVWFYLGKLLWPHPLIFIYPRWQVNTGSWISYLPLLAVIACLLALWLMRETRLRPVFFTAAYFVGALLPVLGLVDGYFWRYSLVGDHFQYLASMGPLALAGAGLALWFETLGKTGVWLKPVLVGAILSVFCGLVWTQGKMYQNVESLWYTTLSQNPSCWMAHGNLGIALVQSGHVPEAIAQFEQTVQLKPDDAVAHWNLGEAYIQTGRVTEAIAQFEQASEIEPDFAGLQFSLGTALLKTGHTAEAIEHFQDGLKINPVNAEAQNNLATALLWTGRTSEAIEHYKTALKIKPNYVNARYNLDRVQALLRDNSTHP